MHGVEWTLLKKPNAHPPFVVFGKSAGWVAQGERSDFWRDRPECKPVSLWASADQFSKTHGLVSFAALRAPGPFYFGVIGVDRAAAHAAEHLVLGDI